MSKCKVFNDCSNIDEHINYWLNLLGPNWKVSHVVLSKYKAIVFVERVLCTMNEG